MRIIREFDHHCRSSSTRELAMPLVMLLGSLPACHSTLASSTTSRASPVEYHCSEPNWSGYRINLCTAITSRLTPMAQSDGKSTRE